jgi:diaminopimelate epimerase
MLTLTKYEGLGNDIAVFDFPAARLGLNPAALTRFLRGLAHRSLGVGCDEIAFVSPAGRGRDAAVVTFYNSDGSHAEMCGNGMRCIAKHLYEKKRTGGKKVFGILTDSGSRQCRVFPNRSGRVDRVSVEMGGVRRLDGRPGRLDELLLTVEGRTREVLTASMGNPHAVLFGRFPTDEMRRIGEALQDHELFPAGVNVGFAEPSGESGLDLVVWERGCGFTLACGSGACAAAAASIQRKLVRPDRPVDVSLPGGVLRVSVSESGGSVTMTGPARRIFTAGLDPAFLSLYQVRIKK